VIEFVLKEVHKRAGCRKGNGTFYQATPAFPAAFSPETCPGRH
jgi:hypothetical protein